MVNARWTCTPARGLDTWRIVVRTSSGGVRLTLSGVVEMSVTPTGVRFASAVSVEDASGNSVSHALPEMMRLRAALSLVEADFERIAGGRP